MFALFFFWDIKKVKSVVGSWGKLIIVESQAKCFMSKKLINQLIFLAQIYKHVSFDHRDALFSKVADVYNTWAIFDCLRGHNGQLICACCHGYQASFLCLIKLAKWKKKTLNFHWIPIIHTGSWRLKIPPIFSLLNHRG